ncbi:hypothetical protein WJX73_007358 [Symbiochloris irregularis]|uniref:MPN domain-containing protein n=1 Tax=Symbiochloris irregularis TaxID=706552 RepID=A0AAW1NNG4_9CHLO
MALASCDHCVITAEAFQVCTMHALSNEKEEIMGMLVGNLETGVNGLTVARIWAVVPLIRSDRRADRVEATPEQLASCSGTADDMSKETGVSHRVIGWYHSHPRIAVFPSHVDVSTQGGYQMLDPGFIGLIWSVFDTPEDNKKLQLRVTAFQSVPADSLPAPMLLDRQDSFLTSPPDTPLSYAIKESMRDARQDTAFGGQQMARMDVQLRVVQARCPAEQHLARDVASLLRVLHQEEQHALHAALLESKDRGLQRHTEALQAQAPDCDCFEAMTLGSQESPSKSDTEHVPAPPAWANGAQAHSSLDAWASPTPFTGELAPINGTAWAGNHQNWQSSATSPINVSLQVVRVHNASDEDTSGLNTIPESSDDIPQSTSADASNPVRHTLALV